MKCQTVNDKLDAVVDGRIEDPELAAIHNHLVDCADCESRYRQLLKLKSALRCLPARVPPPELTTRLEVLASRASALRRRRLNPLALWQDWAGMWRVWVDGQMRRVAVSAAGGVISALLTLALLGPMYATQTSYGRDVPTALVTEAALKRATLSFVVSDRELVVDVLVDDQGRMLDYEAPPGQVWQYDEELRRCVENTLLCTEFKPATMFGQPKSGLLRITLRSNQVDVQG